MAQPIGDRFILGGRGRNLWRNQCVLFPNISFSSYSLLRYPYRLRYWRRHPGDARVKPSSSIVVISSIDGSLVRRVRPFGYPTPYTGYQLFLRSCDRSPTRGGLSPTRCRPHSTEAGSSLRRCGGSIAVLSRRRKNGWTLTLAQTPG